jgi:hypothetical protein
MSLLTQFYGGGSSGGGGISAPGNYTLLNTIFTQSQGGNTKLVTINTTGTAPGISGEWLYSNDGGASWVSSGTYATDNRDTGSSTITAATVPGAAVHPTNGDCMLAEKTYISRTYLYGIGGPLAYTGSVPSTGGAASGGVVGSFYAGGNWGYVYVGGGGGNPYYLGTQYGQLGSTWSNGFTIEATASCPAKQRGPNGPVYFAYIGSGTYNIGRTTDFTSLSIRYTSSSTTPGLAYEICPGGAATQNGITISYNGSIYYTTDDFQTFTAATVSPLPLNVRNRRAAWCETTQRFYVVLGDINDGYTYLKSTDATGSNFTTWTVDTATSGTELCIDQSPGPVTTWSTIPVSRPDFGYIFDQPLN